MLNNLSEILESFFGNFSFALLFFAMVCYWIDTAFFDATTAGKLTKQMSKTGPFTYSLDFLKLENIATAAMIIANVSLIILLLLRWQNSGHFPLSNLYESLMFLCWSCTSIYLFILKSTYPLLNNSKKQTFDFFFYKLLGSIASPCALFINAYATFSLPKEMQNAAPLVPALQSNWLMMHVTVMIISYSALMLGSLLAIAFLIVTSNLVVEGTSDINKNPLLLKQLGVTSAFTTVPAIDNKPGNMQTLAKNLDNLSYRILGIGFPFLTIGILSGAVWANEAWGSYWSWDPKETWALLTWLVFAIYLHMRLSHGWQGKKPAIMASLGFLTVWFCFLGVNLLGEGLHSYGWVLN